MLTPPQDKIHFSVALQPLGSPLKSVWIHRLNPHPLLKKKI